LLSVAKQLRTKNKLKEIGGSYYLASLTNKVVSSANIEFHVRILVEKSIGRKLIELANNIMRDAYDETNDVLELVSKYSGLLSNVFVSNQSSIIELKDGLRKVLRNVVENKSNKKPSGMLTGFTYFDNRSGGLQPSDLVVIAGETSQGKSSLALCIAKHIAENGIPVAFYSLEMSTIQLCARLTSIASDVSSSEILYSKVDDAKFNLINYGIGKIENLPIYIDENDNITSSIKYRFYND